MKICKVCLDGPESCGWDPARLGDLIKCFRCGVPTRVRTCCGAERHAGPCQTPAEPPAPVVPRQPAPQRTWLAERARTQRVAPRQRHSVQPKLMEELSEYGLDTAQQSAGAVLWDEFMRGIEYQGGHFTAKNLLHGMFRHAQVPTPPPWDRTWLAPLDDGPNWTARRWLCDLPSLTADMDTLSPWDVNGMYLSAADGPLGTGAPDLLQWPSEGVLNRPGWVSVSSLENAPYGIGDRWEEGMWMPTDLVKYMAEKGAQFLMPQGLSFLDHRHWLQPHVKLLRAARSGLIAAGGQRGNPDVPENPVAVAVLDVVKDVTTRLFGGVLRPQGRETNTDAEPGINHSWARTTIGRAQSRMFRGLDKLMPGPVAVAGFMVDAAWLVMPSAYQRPPGLEISTQLGKFKPPARTVRWADAADAHAAGEHETIRAMLAGEVNV